MGIMENMRGSTDSTFMQIVIAGIIIAFIGWFAVPQGNTVNVAFTVDGERVLQGDFGRMAYAMRSQFDAGQGRKMSNEEFNATVVPAARELMTNKILVVREAKAMGLAVSDREVALRIKQDDQFIVGGEFDEEKFRGFLASVGVPYSDDLRKRALGDRRFVVGGKFDEELYQRHLKNLGKSNTEYEQSVREDLLFQKMEQLIKRGVGVAKGDAVAAFVAENTTYDLSYVSVTQAAVEAAQPITDADVTAYVAANKDTLQAEYDVVKASKYTTPATVTLSTIRLNSTAADAAAMVERLGAVRAELASGTGSFEDLARKWSEDASAANGGSLGSRGLVGLSTIVRDAIADLEIGGLTEVVDEGDVVSIYRVDAKTEASEVSFEVASVELARQKLAGAQVDQAMERIRAGWANGVLDPAVVESFTLMSGELPQQNPSIYFPGPGQPPASALEAVAEQAPEAGTLLGPFAAMNGDRFLVRVGKKTVPAESDPAFEDGWRGVQRELMSREQDRAWDTYKAALRDQADIEIPGEAAGS